MRHSGVEAMAACLGLLTRGYISMELSCQSSKNATHFDWTIHPSRMEDVLTRGKLGRGATEILAVSTDQASSEQEARKGFTTYLLFLTHFSNILRRKGETYSTIIRKLFREQEQYLRTVELLVLDDQKSKRLRKMLFNAWNSGMVARLNSSLDRELLTVTNQWKPTQAYYALYFLLTPLRMVKAQGGFDRGVGTHESTLTFATNNLCSSLPMPWRCTYEVELREWQRFPSPPTSRAKS